MSQSGDGRITDAVKKAAQLAKKHKLISRGLSQLPHPAAKVAAAVARQAGYGKDPKRVAAGKKAARVKQAKHAAHVRAGKKAARTKKMHGDGFFGDVFGGIGTGLGTLAAGVGSGIGSIARGAIYGRGKLSRASPPVAV